MALTVGSRLGHYDVTALIGEGGMGQVYQATDTTLNRQVALKILPEAFASDPDRLARFQREAQVLASLNHPNIAAIYGIEESGGTRALVLELVEGPTLADRIAQGPIPLDEALPIAKQIAEALEAAHEAGVIHRDLKPANIKVKDDGTVKVLDFGLAKALDTTPQGDPSLSPTLTAAATQMGVIMGTAAYMSPEQARGSTADHRADIWSFGAVLYEMLVGKRLFDGATVSDTLASVLKTEPDWRALSGEIPSSIRKLLRRCLSKERRKRLQHIGDARVELDESLAGPSNDATEAHPSPRAAGWRQALPWVGGIVLAVMTGYGVWVLTRPEIAPADLIRFTILPPNIGLQSDRRDLAISPDGTQIVYANRFTSAAEIHLRRFDQLISSSVQGAHGYGPFFSPNGEWIGFQSYGRTLQKISIAGGLPVTLAELDASVYGEDWGTDGQIILGTYLAGLFRVPEDGGEPEPLTTLEAGETSHVWPSIIPGANAVLFVIGSEIPLLFNAQLAVLNLDTREVTRLGLAGTSVSGGDPPALPGRPPEFDSSGSGMRNSPS